MQWSRGAIVWRVSRNGSGDVPSGVAAFDPLVNLSGEKLPQPSELVRGHSFGSDPFVDRIRVHPQMRRNIFDR